MLHCFRYAVLAACGLAWASPAAAQGFAAVVSPPRFEDRAAAGATYRNVVEITNVGAERAHFQLKTADWKLDATGGVEFSDALAPGSCRPWVGIEAPEITVAPKARRRYRFEVAVPAGAPAGECRFAILIEGDPEPARGPVAMPVAGRIAVIVYLTLGDGAARLELVDRAIETVNATPMPVLRMRNTGNAHGRMEGIVDGTDASGRRYSFVPSSLPILPGETRSVVLSPQADPDQASAPAIAYPLRVKGRLDWGNQHTDLDATFAP